MITVDTVPSVNVIKPYTDPPNTFRATSVRQMAFIVPTPPLSSELTYNVGIPLLNKTIYTIQNNTVSNFLEVDITLPTYYKLDIGPHFSVAPTGTVNVVVSFDNDAATKLTVDTHTDDVVFNIKPLNVTGPVFVDKNAVPPKDLNLLQFGDLPRTGSPQVLNPEVVYVPTLVPLPAPPTSASSQLSWKDGTTGEIKPGSPPAGWIIEADGAAYPPLIPPDQCNPTQSPVTQETDPVALTLEVKNVPLNKPTAKRTAIVFTEDQMKSFMPNTTITTLINQILPVFIVDIGPTTADWKIQNYAKKYFGDKNVDVTSQALKDYLSLITSSVIYNRSGTNIPSDASDTIKLTALFTNGAVKNGYKVDVDSIDSFPFGVAGQPVETRRLIESVVVTATAILSYMKDNNL